MMSEELELSMKLVALWTMNESKSSEFTIDKEYNRESFIARIIRKKFEVFKIPVNVPDELLMLIEIATGSNPGVSQVMLHEIMKNIPNLVEGYTIKSMDYARTYPNRFPMMSNPEDEEHFRKLWDAQKLPEGNRCDTPEYWMECFSKQ